MKPRDVKNVSKEANAVRHRHKVRRGGGKVISLPDHLSARSRLEKREKGAITLILS